MEPKAIINYKGYLIELHQDQNDYSYEYVVKDKDGKVVGASHNQYQIIDDADVNAKMLVAMLVNK